MDDDTFKQQVLNKLDMLLALAGDPNGPAPAGYFANHLSNGPAPLESLSSPMQVLFRHYPGKTENEIQVIINNMTLAEFERLPLHVREKMAERTAYFHGADSTFVAPKWYNGKLQGDGTVEFSPVRPK